MNSPLVIAIDGPAASGKGTLARRIATHYGMEYLDTGSLYRAVAAKLLAAGGRAEDVALAVRAAQNLQPQDLQHPDLRSEATGKAASIVAVIPAVRTALLEYQRNFAKSPRGAVLDGRDIGTVILPDADLKFFITASAEARAQRRFLELQSKGTPADYSLVLADIQARDARDETRAIAPLKPAADAVIVDTSEIDADAVFQWVAERIGA